MSPAVQKAMSRFERELARSRKGWRLPETATLTEAVASVVLFQNECRPKGEGWRRQGIAADTLRWMNLLDAAGLPAAAVEEDMPVLAYEACREMKPGDQRSYFEVLAEASDLTLPLMPDTRSPAEVLLGMRVPRLYRQDLALPGVPSAEMGGIVVCPFAASLHADPGVEAWVAVIRTLKTYGEPVTVLSEPGERLEAAMLTENRILAEASLPEQMAALAGAKLIVGAPNAWTWMAAAWRKKLVYFYPDAEPPRRWFPWSSGNFGRCAWFPGCSPGMLLAGMRRLIASL